ncbi:MAG: transcription-repair coupling factor [Anaerolineae bacterium]|nr:MAG: transcription-repair coupling factor [Anaerolineae bacterium]
MNELLAEIRRLPAFNSLLSKHAEDGPQPSLGLSRAARLPVLAALHLEFRRPILLLSTRSSHTLTLADELALWLPESELLFFREPTSLFYERTPWGENTRRERIQVLTRLATDLIPGLPRPESIPIILAPARALMTRTLPRREFLKATQSLKPGLQIDPLALAGRLAASGYEAVNTVVMSGQFARRGGLLDVWPQGHESPARLDFFGDEIESIRVFEPASQRSAGTCDRLFVPPAREYLSNSESLELQDNEVLSEFHIPLLHPSGGSLLDYLPKDALVLVEDQQAFEDTLNEFEEQAVSLRADAETQSQISADYPLPYFTLPEINDALSRFQTCELGPAGSETASDLAYAFIPDQRFGGRVPEAVEYIQRMHARGDWFTVVSRQAARLQELWEQSLTEIVERQPHFETGSLTEGWLLTSEGGRHIHLLTDSEIFGWQRPQPRHRPRLQADAPEASFAELEKDDLVVHVDHGLGRFIGLVKRSLDGQEQEFLAVEYANADQLYVPVHQADRLSPYIGVRGHQPGLSRLGGPEWQSVKSRARKAAEDIAEELLELYARRQVAQGFTFSPDSLWQKEMEASFPYIETEDQLRVLADVKHDMESPRPMDRLICGDVGYGKTEVALRAAFKAVMDGKQVAMLVPTTILAQQHFYTFRQRLAAFPTRIEMLSRFRSPSEQREILEQLSNGALDIVIGTHRLFGSDVSFKDLGLLIIDEEQRFGVTHKEHLKKMRTEVDVLTLTATPIPRTLYMALTGARDISTINTPPEERLPILTHVGPYSPNIVRQAILRELERGGQVFFVHNRVQTIEGIKRQVADLVPEARLAVVHGQMAEKELGQRMRQFTAGEIDVLLSTSIIESGLDIPNANTLIIDRADTFGLAQLYQLRGRVGRGAQRAYAYFFQHRTRSTTEEGRMRLDTIAENTQLGAGFNIAMRDLEIRGTGDFLGTRQHGHIAAIGLNLYTRLLSQAIEEIKTQGRLSPNALPRASAFFHPIINIDLPLTINIPDTYVPDDELRLKLYRRLAETHDLQKIDELESEFRDRFGPLPDTVQNLILLLRVKHWAERARVASITTEAGQFVIRLPEPKEGKSRRLPSLPQPARVGKNAIWLPFVKEDWPDRLIGLLTHLSKDTALATSI